MKRRTLRPEDSEDTAVRRLCRALTGLRGAAEVRAFLDDLCTPAEMQALADRWSVVPHLLAGEPYREIHERTAVSVTTIGRVARTLSEGVGYRIAARRARLPGVDAVAAVARTGSSTLP